MFCRADNLVFGRVEGKQGEGGVVVLTAWVGLRARDISGG
jgi:hypothetical protein